jgi:hypothetical protein
MYRAIVEMSNMSNNDEYYLHSDSVEGIDKIFSGLYTGAFDNPMIMCIRKVDPDEIKAGLNTKQVIRALDSNYNYVKIPELTHLLDEVGKMIQHLHARIVDLKISPQDAVVHAIAYSYYDCMSGGASHIFLAAARYLIKNWNVPMDAQIYPKGSDGSEWTTIAEFLEDIKGIPEFGTKYLEPIKQMLVIEGAKT